MEDDGQVSALVCDNGSGMVKVRAAVKFWTVTATDRSPPSCLMVMCCTDKIVLPVNKRG